MASKKTKIFVSHASKDKALADKLVDLLINGCAVNPNDVLCTSLEGKGIPAGTSNFIAFLQEQLQNPDLVILIVSENFFASPVCLCELGAVWGLNLPNIPLVVPPVKKSHLKATLAVTQAGDITNSSYLDELRDEIKERLKTEVPTATWNVKRELFLNGINDLIRLLGKPDVVSLAKFNEIQDLYQAALAEIKAKLDEITALKSQNDDLKKCKDAEQVKAVVGQYSSSQKRFDELWHAASMAVGKLSRATRASLYYEQKGGEYYPVGDQWDDVRVAEDVQEVASIGAERCDLNRQHPRVKKALQSIKELSSFLENLRDADFFEDFEEKHEFPADMSNKEFWQTFLSDF